MGEAEKVISILSQAQLDFIHSELGCDKDTLGKMDDDAVDDLYDRICDIEVEETVAADDNELSERGKMAVGIVTVIGNELYGQEDDSDE